MRKIKDKGLRNKEWLEIDECSMLTKDLLALTSEVVAKTRAQDGIQSPHAFGGMNVILFGDFHQFPPVGHDNAALYRDSGNLARSVIGKSIYDQFTTVVLLTQQIRVTDHVWNELLQRLRTGDCTDKDIEIIDSLVLEDKCDNLPDFQQPPWDEAILVTSRQLPRDEWNLASIRQHCNRTGQRWYNCPAEDTCGRGREGLSAEERLLVAGTPNKNTGQLSDNIVLAIGMKAMIVRNIATEADLANGTRGIIEDIILDPREDNPIVDEETGDVTLKYPPALVLFRSDKDDLQCEISGLERGLLPIIPLEVGFTVHTSQGSSRIHRHQLAIIPGYAFTHHKGQGQMIEIVIVDLGKPPTGKLSPFNAYVALSCSRGRHSIRLLRKPDRKLFTTHPSPALRYEDERLVRLNLETKERYSMGLYEWSNIY